MRNFIAVLARIPGDEKGSVLILTLMILAILTIIGLAATQSTFFEIQVASNDQFYRQSFEAAETGLSLVIADSVAVGDGNTDETTYERLAYQGATTVRQVRDRSTDSIVSQVNEGGAGISGITADVTYQGASTGASLRGSGYSAGKFRAHDYVIDSTGTGARNARTQVGVGGYRVGF